VERLNLQVAWIAILLGLLSGTAIGLKFAGEDWLGGYASWRRRLLRLGHVALIGTGLLNFAFVAADLVMAALFVWAYRTLAGTPARA
jgi:hypothetical protein